MISNVLESTVLTVPVPVAIPAPVAVIVIVSPIVFTSDTPFTATVCGLFQLPEVKVIVGGKMVKAFVSLDASVMILSVPGSPVRVTVI